MSWTGAITTLKTHMDSAGTAFVRGGEPGVPASKTAAWYYVGTTDCELIQTTLTDHPFDEQVEVRFYWPVATRDSIPAETLEHEVRDVTRAFIAAVYADDSLGENCTHVEVGDTTAGWLDLGGQPWRISTVPLSLGFTDTEPIAR